MKLKYGEISGPFYNKTHPTEEFKTEDDAVKYAFETNKYGKWLIVPIVKFE